MPFKGHPGWQRPARISHFSVSKILDTFFFLFPHLSTAATVLLTPFNQHSRTGALRSSLMGKNSTFLQTWSLFATLPVFLNPLCHYEQHPSWEHNLNSQSYDRGRGNMAKPSSKCCFVTQTEELEFPKVHVRKTAAAEWALEFVHALKILEMLRALCHMCPPEWDGEPAVLGMTWEMPQPCKQALGCVDREGHDQYCIILVTNVAFLILKYLIPALVEVTALLCPLLCFVPPHQHIPVPVSAKLTLIKASCCTYSFFWDMYISPREKAPYISINTHGCGVSLWAGALSSSSGVAGRQPGSKWVPVSCAST